MKYSKPVLFLASLSILLIFAVSYAASGDFLTQQKKFERVKTTIRDKGKLVEQNLRALKIDKSELNILIVAYKMEKEITIYAKKKSETFYSILSTYPICSSSGKLGPKRAAGDYQVPEGFYHIDRFNPTSSFYLSLGVSYPNQSDRKKSKAKNLGGDIFIHGSCVTIGCMPLTDDKIKEVYLYAIQAKANGQSEIPVYIYPFKMTEMNMAVFSKRHKEEPDLIDFWSNLKKGYDKFEKEKTALNYSVDKEGNYVY